MRYIHYLDTERAKKAVLNTAIDEKILEVRELEGTGREYDSTRGTTLYLHTTKNGGKIYYYYHWTRWQGEEDQISITDEEDAKNFCETNIQYLNENEVEHLEAIGMLNLEETA